MSSQASSSPPSLLQSLEALIAYRGPMTFAEYMIWCLYEPTRGYYNKPEQAHFADYYTSVDVHPIFGRLIARQMEEMWRGLDRPARFRVVECGAGVGRLASHILDFAERQLPDFYDALHYVAVEMTPARRANHEIILQRHMAKDHAESSEDLPERTLIGCIFSNELLDAMPVHRVICRGGELQEIQVGVVEGKFAEVMRPVSTPAIAEYFKRQHILFREGQIVEVGLDACRWITEAGKSLARGFVMTVDYGYEARELFSERRMRGTLLAYKDHKVSENYYDSPGDQDLTAHANFTALELWGRDGGLEPLGLVPQSRFLVSLGKGNEFADLYDPGQTETERVRAQLGLSQLLHPEGMGETFQVFIQQKGIPGAKLTGLQPL
jgi:SAM-dependent MidA family methyltransferase